MRIRVLCIGKLKERATKDWLAEYQKRLTKYAPVSWLEIRESSPKQEAQDILRSAKDSEFMILFDRQGRTMASEQFADLLRRKTLETDILFVLGGPEGVTEDVRKRAQLCLSFGPMTFGHQVARIMAAEQVYRAFTIIKGEPYHK